MFAEKLRLDGRVAVVTGGGQGIGLSCARALGEFGARVVIADIDGSVAEAGRAVLAAEGVDVTCVQLDVTDTAQVDAVAQDIVRRYGGVDILVANAGVGAPPTPAENVPDDLWLRVNNVNYNGVFWCDRAFGRPMLKAGRGSIVNVGSMSGIITNRPQKQSFYNASKAGVHQLTQSLAAEWADRGVRVNAVAPTYIETPMTGHAAASGLLEHWLRDTPMGRLGQVDEIASVVHFLASDASSLMTGTTVVADAGFTCW